MSLKAAAALLLTGMGLQPGLAWAVQNHGAGAPRKGAWEVALIFQQEASPEPLTTERAWRIDFSSGNPHRQRWAISRTVELQGLRAVAQEGGRYGAEADAVVAKAQTFLRPAGPWYRPVSEYPCDGQIRSEFGTEEGSRRALAAAAQAWQEILDARKFKLSILLRQISATSPAIVPVMANHLFNAWLLEVTNEWRTKGGGRARREEWNLYRSQAKELGLCKSKVGEAPPTWDRMMEPLPVEPKTRLLARAPARRWNGLFSVRLNIKMGTQTLNGQFLVDSGAPRSLISPVWLESQGILPVWVEIPGASLEPVIWGGQWSSERALARQARVDEVELSGHLLPLREFLLFETDFFEPPETITTCCDGILGADFLKSVIVEFVPSTPAELKLWATEGFGLPTASHLWTEVEVRTPGELVSDCGVQQGALALRGTRWDTGVEDVLGIHLPWQSKFSGQSGADLLCAQQVLGRALPVSFPKAETKVTREEGPLSRAYPAVDVGIRVLERGAFISDLPHGRMWFAKDGLEKPVLRNTTGLRLEYVFREGERVLEVLEIKPKSSARVLAKAGLKPGMSLTRIDSKPAHEMDLWEVEQRLAGKYGNQVSVHWSAGKTEKVVPLKVRD